MVERNHLLKISELIRGNQSCQDLVQAFYGLNHLEFQIFCHLIHGKQSATIKDLLDELQNGERTRINRALNHLIELNLMKRERVKTGKAGNHSFLYSTISFDDLKNEMNKLLEVWYNQAKTEIENLDEGFLN